MMRGIDVSKWQKKVDFNKAKDSGIGFAILRAGYGKEVKQKDVYFDANYNAAKAAGLPVGAYWYSYAKTIEDAKKEAQACISVLKGKQFEFPIYYDVEEQSQFAKGKNFIDSIITVFCDALESAGYYVGLYMSASPLKTYVSDSIKKRYSIWVAQYRITCTYDGEFSIWQYSSKGKVPGISGNCDMNECYTDFPTIIVNNGFNGFLKKTDSVPRKKTLDEIAGEVIDGKWGNGSERRKRIKEAGYDYDAVRRRVNAMLK